MNWVEIAFIVVFFGFSLLGRRRGSAKPGVPPEGAVDAQPQPHRPEALTLGSALAAWEQAMTARLPPVASSPPPPEARAPLPAVAKKVKVAAPPPLSLEILEVDRAAEHDRFHERYVESSSAPAGAERRRAQLRIRGAGELRRAVLLAEALGPPRSMRDLEGRIA